MLVSNHEIDLRELVTPVTSPGKSRAPGDKRCIAIPGKRTTAWLALQLRMLEEGVQPEADSASPPATPVRGSGAGAPSSEEHLMLGGPNRSVEYHVVPFDQIIPRVRSGEFTAGLIIHEGQLTYAQSGLHLVEDLGKWWTETRGLPLPLGGNAIRRDVGPPEELQRICTILLDSIRYALDHRDEAVGFALGYARDMGRDLADKFVGMYVNDWTLDYGDRGRKAVAQLLQEGMEAGIVPKAEIDFVSPG
jgi:1,4-dihydroxy-6-naphthoate synthase